MSESKPHSELPNDAETDALVKTITNSLVRLQGWLKPGTLKWSRDGLDALYVLERKYEYMTKTAQSYATERERLVEQLEVASLEQLLRVTEAKIAKIRAAAVRQAEADYQRGWLSCSWVLDVIDSPVYVPAEHRYPEGDEPDEGLREAHARMLEASNPAKERE